MFITIKLEKKLKSKKISIEELSERTGVSSADLSLLKRIKIRDPRFSILQHICEELNCEPTDIIEFHCEDVQEEVKQINP